MLLNIKTVCVCVNFKNEIIINPRTAWRGVACACVIVLCCLSVLALDNRFWDAPPLCVAAASSRKQQPDII